MGYGSKMKGDEVAIRWFEILFETRGIIVCGIHTTNDLECTNIIHLERQYHTS